LIKDIYQSVLLYTLNIQVGPEKILLEKIDSFVVNSAANSFKFKETSIVLCLFHVKNSEKNHVMVCTLKGSVNQFTFGTTKINALRFDDIKPTV